MDYPTVKRQMMKIGELCKKANVGKELVRHYEELGLLHAREIQAGSRFYRDFPVESIERIRLIQVGKRLGLTLKEIKPMLDAYMGDELNFADALTLLQAQYDKFEQQIAQAKEVQALIKHKIAFVEGKLKEK